MKKGVLLLITLIMMTFSVACMAESESAGTITMSFDLSSQPSGKDVNLWIPYPLSDADQVISNITISGDFAQSAVYSDRKYSTPMLFASWDNMAKSRKLVFSFDVVRKEVVKKDFPEQESAWNAADFGLYLAATSLGPLEGMVQSLSDKIVGDKTSVYDKAKAIYDWVCENMHRDPETRGCGPGDVCSLLDNLGGKCTDIHSVLSHFVVPPEFLPERCLVFARERKMFRIFQRGSIVGLNSICLGTVGYRSIPRMC